MNIDKITTNTTLSEIIKAEDFETTSAIEEILSFPKDKLAKFNNICGIKGPLVRIAQLMIYACEGDGVISDDEKNEAMRIFEKWNKSTEDHIDATILWNSARHNYKAKGLSCILDNAKIFKDFLSIPALNNIVSEMIQSSKGDWLDTKEEKIIHTIVMYWYGKIDEEQLNKLL